jgi:hypothetical protein
MLKLVALDAKTAAAVTSVRPRSAAANVAQRLLLYRRVIGTEGEMEFLTRLPVAAATVASRISIVIAIACSELAPTLSAFVKCR